MNNAAALSQLAFSLAAFNPYSWGIALHVLTDLAAGRPPASTPEERMERYGASRYMAMTYAAEHDEVTAIVAENFSSSPPDKNFPPPPKGPQTRDSKGFPANPGVPPLYTRVGFIKPENLSLKPAVETETPQTVDVSELWPLFDDARKREGVPLVGSLDRAGNVRFRAIKARVVSICQGQRPKVAAFIGRVLAHARARGYGGQLARLIARWNELERLAKADLGIGGTRGARGARRASCETGGVHQSHVPAALPAAPPPSTTTREKLRAGLTDLSAGLRARFGVT
jgi:hypothetical protein